MNSAVRRLLAGLVLAGGVTLVTIPALTQAQPEAELTPNACFMSGKLYFNQKVYDKAEKQFRLAVDKDSTQAEYHAWLATALCEVAKQKLAETTALQGEERLKAVGELATSYAEANREFTRAIAMDPKKQQDFSGDNLLHYWVDLYKQADGLFRDKKYDEALEIYKLLTVLDPLEPQGKFWVGYTMDRLGKTREGVLIAAQARDLANQRINEMGDCSQFKSRERKTDCKSKITKYQTVIGNVDKFTKSKFVALGREALEDAMKLDSDPDQQRTQLEEARKMFTLALEQDPSLTSVEYDLGNTYFKYAGSYLTGTPDTAHAYPYFRQAAGLFEKLTMADSVDADTRRDALYNASRAWYGAEEWTVALPALLKYIDLDPKDSDSYRRVAKCYHGLKKPGDAVPYVLMFGALSDAAESKNLAEVKGTTQNMYPNSDQAASLTQAGDPDEIKSMLEKETGKTVVTFIWWKKGEVRHFIEGQLVGTLKFKPVS